MAEVKIEDGCATLGTVEIDEDFVEVVIHVQDPYGDLSTVRLPLNQMACGDAAAEGKGTPRQVAQMVAETLKSLIRRAWDVGQKRMEKGEPSL